MESVLLVIVIVLLLLDLTEHRSCHDQHQQRRAPVRRVQSASARISRLTDQAVQDMLDEARSHLPGQDRRTSS